MHGQLGMRSARGLRRRQTGEICPLVAGGLLRLHVCSLLVSDGRGANAGQRPIKVVHTSLFPPSLEQGGDLTVGHGMARTGAARVLQSLVDVQEEWHRLGPTRERELARVCQASSRGNRQVGAPWLPQGPTRKRPYASVVCA